MGFSSLVFHSFSLKLNIQRTNNLFVCKNYKLVEIEISDFDLYFHQRVWL